MITTMKNKERTMKKKEKTKRSGKISLIRNTNPRVPKKRSTKTIITTMKEKSF